MTSPRQTAVRLKAAEELPIGREMPLGSHVVSKQELVDFARQWDPQYFHVDEAAASKGYFHGLIASGLHTASIFQKLCVGGFFGQYDAIAGKEMRSLRFLRPVRPGDVLAGSFVVRSVKPDGRGRALVAIEGTLRNQHGKPVMTLELDSLLRSNQQESQAPGK